MLEMGADLGVENKSPPVTLYGGPFSALKSAPIPNMGHIRDDVEFCNPECNCNLLSDEQVQ